MVGTTTGAVEVGDSLVYVIAMPRDTQVMLHVETTSGVATDSVEVRVYVIYPPMTTPISYIPGIIIAGPPSAAPPLATRILDGGGSRLILLVVRGLTGSGPIPFRLVGSGLSLAPETASATLVANDSVVTERIEVRGDEDLFSLAGSAGDIVHVFLAARDAVTGDTLSMRAYANGGPVDFAWHLIPADAVRSLDSARFSYTFEYAATLQLRITGGASGMRYALLPYRVARTPEDAIAAITLGVDVIETILLPGDIDEFTYQATAGEGLELRVALDDSIAAGLYLSVERVGAATLVPEPFVAAGTLDASTPIDIPVPNSGEIRMRITSTNRMRKTGNGGYRLRLSSSALPPVVR